MFTRLGSFVAFVTILSACTESARTYNADQKGNLDPRIISDRPLAPQPILATVKLASPSLIEAAQKTESGLVVPPAAREAIEKEQAAVIQLLKSASPDVEILYRYRAILNGLAFRAPANFKIEAVKIPGVLVIEPARKIGRPVIMAEAKSPIKKSGFETTSVDFIEASRVHNEIKTKEGVAVRGQQIRVGVIDTGIDFTHKMLGGSGNPSDYKSVNPAEPTGLFPNSKVVGGIDLVGTDFNAASDVFADQVPKPDANPLDEGAHGSHVAGTIAGIGDGINTYSGVAPDASLYAIKVFGANGSTSDFVVVAGLEFAADPNQDGDLNDHLDVVNLSLGSGFGQPMILYTEAIRNLTRGGTIVVASAGNSGPIDYIVGAPSTADDALSVAASVDNMPHNWKFPAVAFQTPAQGEILAKAVEGPISSPVEGHPEAKGDLVYIGLGDKPLSEDMAAAVKGKVAFLDRGVVSFAAKLQLAAGAGAIGAVVANNQPGEPIAMGGDGSVSIPAIMITKDLADQLKAAMKAGAVRIEFVTGKTIAEPQIIDTITDFSSKGPRSVDSLLKPEIAAPGLNIVSAAMGSGNEGVEFSGTSMAGPHMAGVMALMRQIHPQISVDGLKSLVMSTTQVIHDKKERVYPLSLQGSGRVRTLAAATAPLTISPTAISVGNVQVGAAKTLRRELTITNISENEVTLSPGKELSPYLALDVAKELTLAPQASAKLPVLITLKATPEEQSVTEIDGAVVLNVKSGDTTTTQRVPILAMVTKQSEIQAAKLKVFSASAGDATDAHTELTLVNPGRQAGLALPFNLIGMDSRKPTPDVTESFRSRSCDLESAGYRIVHKKVDGEEQNMLQVAIKLYEPLTTWILCEVSMQIDTNGDQLADQELVGIATSHLSGLGGLEFRSLLLDAVKAREIRQTFEKELAEGKEEPQLDYKQAIIDAQAMATFNHSTVAIVEAPMKLIGLRPNGELAVKIAALYADSEGLDPDDFLGGELNRWTKLAANPLQASFAVLPEAVTVAAGATQTVALTHGAGAGPLVVYMPNNSAVRTARKDPQARILKPVFVGPK